MGKCHNQKYFAFHRLTTESQFMICKHHGEEEREDFFYFPDVRS